MGAVRISVPSKARLGARLVITIFLAVIVFGLALLGYGIYLRRSAQRLIREASEVRSVADVTRGMPSWRRMARRYEETASPDGLSRSHLFQLENGLLSVLHLVPSTGLSLQVVVRSGDLRQVLLGMYTSKSSVWIQEEFSASAAADHPSANVWQDKPEKPEKSIVTVSHKMTQSIREKVFALNAGCLVRPHGCGSAEEILPTLPSLQHAATSKVTTR
jgi:hypothetical protein